VSLVVGLSAAAALFAIGLLHVHWALGGHWPYADSGDFKSKLLPQGAPQPGPAATWAVVVLLAVAATLVSASAVGLEHRIFALGTLGVAGVLALRGIGGLLLSGIFRRGSTFAGYDRRVYAPLCVGLSIGALIAVAG